MNRLCSSVPFAPTAVPYQAAAPSPIGCSQDNGASQALDPRQRTSGEPQSLHHVHPPADDPDGVALDKTWQPRILGVALALRHDGRRKDTQHREDALTEHHRRRTLNVKSLARVEGEGANRFDLSSIGA